MIRFKSLLQFLGALILVTCTATSHADTLQLLSTSGGSRGGAEVYPYNFSINGAATPVSLACLNFDREVTTGEKWFVTIHGLDLGASQTAINYRADAYLYSLFGTGRYSNADLQYAIWSIFDPAVSGSKSFTETSKRLADIAMQSAVSSTLIDSGFYGTFLLYTPTVDQTGWTRGTPQEFIGTATTPEPPSVVLLSTAMLFGCIVVLRRRFAAGIPTL